MNKSEEEIFTDLLITLLFEGEIEDNMIEDHVHFMMDNRDQFPEYFS